MKNKLTPRHPFTVLEMIVATGLLSVILFTLLSMLDISQKTMERGVSNLGVVEDARLALDLIEDHVTCVDYAGYIEKNPDGAINESDSPFEIAARRVLYAGSEKNNSSEGNSLTVFTTQSGRLSRTCKVKYTKRGNELIQEMELYDDANGCWSGESTTRTLLTNVIDFKVNIEHYTKLGAVRPPKQVTIELLLLDDDTRKLGYKSLDDAKEKKLNTDKIESAIGKDALKHRYAHFTRIVALEPPEIQNTFANE